MDCKSEIWQSRKSDKFGCSIELHKMLYSRNIIYPARDVPAKTDLIVPRPHVVKPVFCNSSLNECMKRLAFHSRVSNNSSQLVARLIQSSEVVNLVCRLQPKIKLIKALKLTLGGGLD